jgi:hypothetical protein
MKIAAFAAATLLLFSLNTSFAAQSVADSNMVISQTYTRDGAAQDR